MQDFFKEMHELWKSLIEAWVLANATDIGIRIDPLGIIEWE
jgi:hypothetical protein